MNINDAKIRARALMNRHGLNEWELDISTTKRSLGDCNYKRRTIRLSKYFVELNEYPRIKITILHEIAHALTPYAGHSYKWQKMCLKIGGDGKRCASRGDFMYVKPKHRYACKNCGYIWEYHRKMSNYHYRLHRKCGELGKIIKLRK